MKLRQVVLGVAAVLTLGSGVVTAADGRWFVLAGPALTDLSVPLVSGHKEFKFGFLAGAGYEAPLGGNASLLVRALFKTGGTHIDLSSTTDMTYSGNALAVPVLLKIKLGGGSAPFILAGGYAGYMFSPRVEVDSDEDGTETSIPGKDVNAFVYGLAAGAGYEFELRGMSLVVEAEYMYGLSNLDKTGSAKVRASSINLVVGLRL